MSLNGGFVGLPASRRSKACSSPMSPETVDLRRGAGARHLGGIDQLLALPVFCVVVVLTRWLGYAPARLRPAGVAERCWSRARLLAAGAALAVPLRSFQRRGQRGRDVDGDDAGVGDGHPERRTPHSSGERLADHAHDRHDHEVAIDPRRSASEACHWKTPHRTRPPAAHVEQRRGLRGRLCGCCAQLQLMNIWCFVTSAGAGRLRRRSSTQHARGRSRRTGRRWPLRVKAHYL